MFPPLLSCSHLVIPSIYSCFLFSSLYCVQSLPSTQVRLVSNKQIVFCSLSNLHTLLSCCIIYMFVIILPLCCRGTCFPKYCSLFHVTLLWQEWNNRRGWIDIDTPWHVCRVTKADKVLYGPEMAQLINAIHPFSLDQTKSIPSCITLVSKMFFKDKKQHTFSCNFRQSQLLLKSYIHPALFVNMHGL